MTKPMFRKAERKQAKLRLALTGPSGSGKTYSALILAKTLGKKSQRVRAHGPRIRDQQGHVSNLPPSGSVHVVLRTLSRKTSKRKDGFEGLIYETNQA